jgi:hypothetical protein
MKNTSGEGYRTKELYLLNKRSCEMDADVEKGRWKIYL